MAKYKNKYRIESARAQWWDYSSPGAYFLTINVSKNEMLLGEVIDGNVQLSEFGMIVQGEWNKSFEIRKELRCDAFVIMPNHLHEIVKIVDTVETAGGPSLAINNELFKTDSTPNEIDETAPKPSGKNIRPKSISSFISGFKGEVTKRANELRGTPGKPFWHSGFHDHIVRDLEEYNRILLYIENNPGKW